MRVYFLLILTFITTNLYSQSFNSDSSDYSIEQLFQYSLDELLTLKVYSATKFEESANEIPHSIFIITKQDIETYGYGSIAEALQHVPGFYMVDDYSGYKQNFGIRGFYRDEWNQNIVFIVNGIRQRMTASLNNPLSLINVPIQSIERIEIIKGPASVTYGTGAFLGVVNIITNSQSNKTETYASYGSQNTYNAGININRQNEKLSYTINAGFGETDGINQNFKDMGSDTSLLSSGFLYEQFGYAGITAKGEHIYSSISFERATNTRPMVNLNVKNNDYEAQSDFYAFRYILGADYQISDKILFNTSYQFKHLRNELTFDLFGLDNNMETQSFRENSHEADANIKIQWFKKSNISLGANYQHLGSYKDNLDIPLLGLSNHIKTLKSPMEIWGFYSRLGWSILDNLTFRAGLKLEKIDSYELEHQINKGNSYIDPGGTILGSSSDTVYTYPDYGYSILPEVSFLWNINKKNTLKLIYAKAVNKLSVFRINKAQDGIKPEYIHNIEINHSGIISDNLSLNTSIFFNYYKDLIATEFYIKDNQSVQIANNSGEIVTRGIELAIDYRLLPDLRFYLSGNYNYSKDLNHESEYPAYSPKFLGVFNISYSLKDFTFAITNNYVTKSEATYNYALTDPNDISSLPIGRVGNTAPAYFNTGLNIIYNPKFLNGLSANLKVSNLFDQKMYYPVSDFNGWATKGTLGISRTIFVGLQYKF